MKGAAPREGAPRVLVADDFTDGRELVAEALARAGFDVVEAEDGERALAKVVELRPALVLMDLGLPKVDGWEAIRRLKADPRTAHIPVILWTADAATDQALRARAMGCASILTKPCSLRALVDEVKRVLASGAVA